MENISYVGLSHQTAIKKQLTVTANNIANMTTTGYKAQELIFLEHVMAARGGDKNEEISMVIDNSTYRRVEQGALSQTHNPLDMAINGSGYFVVNTDEGARYTRAGDFSLNEIGEIVTKEGYPVVNAAGTPIVVPPGESQITVSGSGTISTENGEIGQLNLVEFDNEQDLIELGGNLYNALDQQALPAKNTKVVQGMLETSNVQPIIEMNKMIEALRSYQSIQKILQTDHERQRGMIAKLSKV